MYTVVSLIVDLAGEPYTIDFTLPLFGSAVYCYGSLRASGSCHGASAHLTCAPIPCFDLRWCEIIRSVLVIPLLPPRFISAEMRVESRQALFLIFLPPVFFCLTELQFGEPFPALLHVFLGRFLRRGRIQCEVRVGIAGSRGHFALEPAQARAVQEENPGRIRAGSGGESRAQDRR